MLVVIGVDILTRSLFNFSFEISDELGGYMLVVITFVSLPVCQISDSFHHVELVQSRLSPFGRAVSHVIFDLLSLTFCVLLLWQLVRFEITSFRFSDHAPTYLATPLWIPQPRWCSARRRCASPCCARSRPTLPACACVE